MDRVPRIGNVALEFGKLLHVIFEIHFRGHPMPEAIRRGRAMWEILAEQCTSESERLAVRDAVEVLDTFREPLSYWQDRFPIERTLEVETPFLIHHPYAEEIQIKGRPDRMAVCYGKLFHVQNRSLAGSKNIGLYSELATEDMHELLYAWAMTKKYPDIPYGGTIYNLLRKLRYRSAPTKAHPEGKQQRALSELLVQQAIPIMPAAQERALHDVVWIAGEMERTIKRAAEGILPARNRELDGGWFGNSRDPYWPVITGQATLADEALYKNRDDPYARSVMEGE